MRNRFCGSLCKLVQRQTYSLLSSRYGIAFCIGSTVLFLVSLLQFGEVALEWSMEKYTMDVYNQVGGFAEKVFRRRACLDEPIDIVYTWVNGSDPRLIEKLKAVKKEWTKAYEERLRDGPLPTVPAKDWAKKGASRTKKGADHWADMGQCPFPNCVPFPAVAVSNGSFNILAALNNKFDRKKVLKYPSNDPSTLLIGFSNAQEAMAAIEDTRLLCGSRCPNMSQVFITSTLKKGQGRLGSVGLLIDVLPDVGKESILRAFRKVFISVVDAVVYKVDNRSNIAVLQFQNEGQLRKATYVPRVNLVIDRVPHRVYHCGLVWKPITHLEKYGKLEYEDISSSRFADNEELRYSLRSVEKFAPWVRKIFIVTNGQIPSWLNLENPRIHVVTHEDIFQNKSHLPTFSSPSIETHIHKIKGLSKQFIYMNDDVFFGSQVWPDDFFTMGKGQKVYLTWPVPNCNEGCPASWISDKYCDKACNVSECDWDGGDCINPQILKWQAQTLQGIGVTTPSEFCHSSCAHTWVGDRYCDAHCNNADCGYDAGDCGLELLRTLPSCHVERDTKEVMFDNGVKAFYLNLTNVFGKGSIAEGEFADHPVVRTAVYSKGFHILSVTLFANLSRVTIPFQIRGFAAKNDTGKVQLLFNVSVCTLASKVNLGTTKGMKITSSTVSPVTYPQTVYNESLYPRHWDLKLQDHQTGTQSPQEKRYLLAADNDTSFPHHVLLNLKGLKDQLSVGDITVKGYNKSVDKILTKFWKEAGKKGDHKQVNAGRKLLWLYERMEEQLPHSSNMPWLSGPTGVKHITIIGPPMMCSQVSLSSPCLEVKKRNVPLTGFTLKVKAWQEKYGRWDPLLNPQQTSFLPWEKQDSFASLHSMLRRFDQTQNYDNPTFHKRKLLDTFADSLLHVSKIYNRAFGYKARKVPAHMPHMIDRDIVYEMQERFWTHFDQTSSHQIRSPYDMQFAFSYQYYIMGVPATLNTSLLFQELDTDKSGALSDRELRTLAARLYELPLDLSGTMMFEGMLKNCSSGKPHSQTKDRETEFYYDSGMPLVTEELLESCHPLIEKLNASLKGKTKYKFEILSDDDVGFKMIRNNLTHVLLQLDWIRKHKRKFICLNDNIDHLGPSAQTIRALVKDFFEAFFPLPSQFEIAKGFRNKYLYVRELRASLKKKEDYKMRLRYMFLSVLVLTAIGLFSFKILKMIRICLNALLHFRVRNWVSRGILEI